MMKLGYAALLHTPFRYAQYRNRTRYLACSPESSLTAPGLKIGRQPHTVCTQIQATIPYG